MKKIVCLAVATAVMAGFTPVFAGGHHGGNHKRHSFGVCSVENCTTLGNHWHSGKIYSGHYYGDGHGHH